MLAASKSITLLNLWPYPSTPHSAIWLCRKQRIMPSLYLFVCLFLILQWGKAAITVVQPLISLCFPTTFPHTLHSTNGHLAQANGCHKFLGQEVITKGDLVPSLVSGKSFPAQNSAVQTFLGKSTHNFPQQPKRNVYVCLHIKGLSLNQYHHHRALLTQCLCGDKDLPTSELTCENNGKIPATGHLLDRTAKEGSAGGKIQDIFCVTKPQLPIFVQATNKKASFICRKQKLWVMVCTGEI